MTIDKLKEQLEWEAPHILRALLEIQNEWAKDMRELKKEIIRLKSLCRRSADEIRYLDNILIDSIENNKVPQYDEEDSMFAGFSSINLLNRLDGKTNGGYVENYDDLHLELKTLDGYAQIEHPDFYRKQEHSPEHFPECKWHKDWHACDCGAFERRGE